MSTGYASADLGALLNRATPRTDPAKSEDDTDLLKTSFLTGQTELTDEQIFNIVIEQPLRDYVHDTLYFYGSGKLSRERVSDYVVSRNRLYIEVKVTLIDGDEHIFRADTNYSSRLNLAHDRQFLQPARGVLTETYGYTIPVVPREDRFDRPESFEAAVKECRKQLDQGMAFLSQLYREQAMAISTTSGEGEDLTIADRFALGYGRALRELAPRMPSFISDLQGFLSEAVAPETVNPPATAATGGAAGRGE